MGTSIPNVSTFEVFKKRLSSLVRRCGDILYNASSMKRIIFLTRLHVGPSHLREHKFKQSLLLLIIDCMIMYFFTLTLVSYLQKIIAYLCICWIHLGYKKFQYPFNDWCLVYTKIYIINLIPSFLYITKIWIF